MDVAATSENAELATWNRSRTIEELRSFIDAHHALLPDAVDVE